MLNVPRLASAIVTAFPDITNLSGEGHTIDRDRLSGVLSGLATDLARAYWVRLAAATFLLLALLTLMFWKADSPTAFATISAALGITAAGSVAALKQVTDEMARVRLLLALAPELTREALTEMAQLISKAL